MKVKVIRKEFTEKSTISDVLIDGEFFCYALEDKDRNLKDSDTLAYVKLNKIFGVTAIPTGTYKMKLSMSNRFKRILPEIMNVKGYEGVRIHRGNTAEDSLGCLILGFKKGPNTVLESGKAENAFVAKLTGETEIELEIVKDSVIFNA